MQVTDNNNISDKLTNLKGLIYSFKLTISGYSTEKDNDVKYTGGVLAGKETIEKIYLLLTPFSENINLLTDKDSRGTWIDQKYYTIKSFLNIITNANDVTAENYRVLAETFVNTLTNIGDIILGSKNAMERAFFKNQEETTGIKELG